MSNNHQNGIGLAELIEKVKQELLSSAPGQDSDTPILFVDSVVLELQVTVSREGSGGISIDVLAIGGGELGGGISKEDVHTVKVTLSPIFDKAKLMEFYQTLHANKVPTMVKKSLDALLKGEEIDPQKKYG